MTGGYSLVVTTTDSSQSARMIAARLLEQKLAACVQIFPVESHYVWQDKVQQESEYALHIKARTDDFDTLSQAIKDVHTYETPEIIRLDIAEGSAGYLNWVSQMTAR